jgi:D-alanine transaminase
MALTAPYPVCWLNGEFLPLADARISPLDRGFLFADAVYEVVPCHAGRPFLFHPHLARLERSQRELGLVSPLDRADWADILRGLATRNDIRDATLYLQVSRGAEWGRNHAPPARCEPTVFAYATPLPPLDPRILVEGVSAVTMPDERWSRCDIKSTSLLANVMAKGRAQDAGAFEAILLADGWLREGSSTTVMLVEDGALLAPPDSPRVLPGTTRDFVFRLAAGLGIRVERRELRAEELFAADEVMVGSATRGALPVTTLDGRPVGHGAGRGKPGPVWQELNRAFQARIEVMADVPFDAPDDATSADP